MQVPDDPLASRVAAIRRDLYGDGDAGIAALARALGIPARTWENYERGVAIPGGVLLRFLVYTGVEPGWLLSGEGERYRDRPPRECLCDL